MRPRVQAALNDPRMSAAYPLWNLHDFAPYRELQQGKLLFMLSEVLTYD
jgi:hypothetical protein